jgi:hypothetical protein
MIKKFKNWFHFLGSQAAREESLRACEISYFEEQSTAPTVYTKIDAFYGAEELSEVFLKYLEKNGHEKTKRWLAASHWTPLDLSQFVEEHGTAVEADAAFRFYMKCRMESDT